MLEHLTSIRTVFFSRTVVKNLSRRRQIIAKTKIASNENKQRINKSESLKEFRCVVTTFNIIELVADGSRESGKMRCSLEVDVTVLEAVLLAVCGQQLAAVSRNPILKLEGES